MKLSDAAFLSAEKMAETADKRHDLFEDQHEENCKDYNCPLPGKVEADLKKKKK